MLRVLELFAGLGACSKALERLGIEHEIIDAVEIDKYAIKSFNAIHDTKFKPQDIRNWNKDIKVDLIMHGSPCQDFSLAGKQAGGDEGSGTRSSLMYETLRIVEKLRPKYVIWENVKNMVSKKHVHNFNKYINRMDQLGYISYFKVLNAKDYGIPQNRERVFTVSIRKDQWFKQGSYWFPQKQELKLRLKDMLEDAVEDKYYLSDDIIKQVTFINEHELNLNYYNYEETNRVYTDDYICPALRTMEGGNRQPKVLIKNATKKGYLEAFEGDSINLQRPTSTTRRGRVGKEVAQTLDTQCEQGVIVSAAQRKRENGQTLEISNREYSNALTTVQKDSLICEMLKKCNLRIRRLTPKECMRLMGFDDEDYEKATKVNSNTQLYKQAGNSIVVNVLEAILRNLLLEPIQGDIEEQTTIFDYI